MEMKNQGVLKLKKNIFLTGFMGAGKTSVGKVLAECLQVEFFDTDELVSAMEKMSIGEIFRLYGEAYFRDREGEVLRMLGRKTPGSCVVSTGGGAVLRPGNLAAMRENGLIVCLHVSAGEAYRRIGAGSDRPLLSAQEPLRRLQELLEARKPFYLEADLSLETCGRSIRQTAAEILARLQGGDV